MLKKFFTCMVAAASVLAATAQDKNFHIYLCIGQSNMEGNAQVEPMDRNNVPDRFKMMAAVDFPQSGRVKGEWYTAVPPLVRQNTGLTPMDYFGRTMVDNLPEEVTVGVVPVAVGGCKIEHLSKDFDPASLANEADWFRNFMKEYDNQPYKRLIECAKEAQKAGVIKGILLHQGESNCGQQDWPQKVKKVYEDILADLGLDAADVPLLVGEVVTSEKGGACGSHNPVVNKVPSVIPTAHVVSAANLPQKGDGLHFTAHGYRVLGCRYAVEMLATMGIDNPKVEYSEEMPYVPKPEPSEGDFVFDFKYFNPQIWGDGTFDADTRTFVAGQWGFGGWEYNQPIDLSGYSYLVAELEEPESNGLKLRMFDTPAYFNVPIYSSDFNGATLIVAELNGMMKAPENTSDIESFNTSQVYRVGFWANGGQPIHLKQVFATNNNPYSAGVSYLEDGIKSECPVYDLSGRMVASSVDALGDLACGIYISNGKKFVK